MRDRRFQLAAVFLAVLMAATPSVRAQRLKTPDQISQRQGVDLNDADRLGQTIPLDLVFTNDAGEPVALREYFDGELPVVLSLVYYNCPVVCATTLDAMAASFDEQDFIIGRDYRVLVVSFNPDESTSHAYGNKMLYLPRYKHGLTAETEAGWVFHTGSQANIQQLADAVGFKFKRLPDGEYSHPVVLTVLAGDGRISRYMYGFDYPPKQMRLALLEASEGKIAKSIGDRVLQYCYRYDPDAGAYSVQAMAIMRLGGGVTVIAIVGLIGALLAGERVRRRLRNRADHDSTATAAGSARALGHQA